jgi:demethylspheroidene O-methyltransferase
VAARRNSLTRFADAWYALRDRLLSDPATQRLLSAFWLTRLVARRRARQVFDLCAGFVYSQVLLACVRLKVFERLRAGPMELAALAPALDLTPDSARRLLDAAVSLELLADRGDGRYGLGRHGAALLGNPAAVAMVEHHALVYRDLADPVALLRGTHPPTELSRYWAYASSGVPGGLGAGAVAAYSDLMSASQALVADEVLSAYPLARHRVLLDVGGGDGTFLSTVAARHPQLRCILFDLPAVAERAQRRFVTADLADRVRAVGGDFARDALPTGADVVSFVRVLHDHDDPTVLALLEAAWAALPPDGHVLIAEPFAGTSGAEPVGAAYFGFYLLAMGHGRARTVGELAALLHRAGFEHLRQCNTAQPLQTGVLVARRAGKKNCQLKLTTPTVRVS